MSVASYFEKFMGLQRQKVQATVASYRELVAGKAGSCVCRKTETTNQPTENKR